METLTRSIFCAAALCMLLPTAHAAKQPYDDTFFNLPPRLSLWGNAGNNTFGEGDGMLPIWGNSTQSIYGDINAKYGDDSAWLVGLGVVGRKIIHNAIWGAYFFTDYNKSPNDNYFPVLNPGLEFMTNRWDAHLNGYIPVGRKNQFMHRYTGTQLGKKNSVTFKGNTQYDSIYNLREDVGAGTDAEVGYTIFNLNRTRVFGGAYFFTPQYTNNIKGIEGGFEIPLRYKGASVEMRDSYDNVNHNTFLLTVRLTFGGLDKTGTPDIRDRMLDPIPRHLGNLQNGDGIPSQKHLVNMGRAPTLGNIFFIDPLIPNFASLTAPNLTGICTYENPCKGLSQARIDAINAITPNANFYLSSGNYNNPAVGSGFNLRNGQSIYGRNSNFTQSAMGDERPFLNDSLLLEGNNNVSSLRIDGHTVKMLQTGGVVIPLQVGVLVRVFATPGTVNIYNTDIASTSTTLNGAVALANNSNYTTLNIYDSSMTASLANVAGSISIGAANLRIGALNMYNSTISSTNSDVTNNGSIAFGFVNNEAGLVTISNSQIYTSLVNGGITAGVLNNSTLGLGLGDITITGSTIMVNAYGANIAAGVLNQANNIYDVSADVNISHSSIAVLSKSNGAGLGSGILAGGSGSVNIDNSAIAATGDDGSIFGITISPTSTVNIKNTMIATNPSGVAFGLPIANSGTLNDNGGNQCFNNGVATAC